ncbi:uncharacterized protein BKA78DRAFT_308538 [Phyllosticta capitalensis]|uniref:uncharacterized protein n=1 Tax=Phyllosticta capitalensis TaxID=121624 RepID=UPI003130A4EF
MTWVVLETLCQQLLVFIFLTRRRASTSSQHHGRTRFSGLVGAIPCCARIPSTSWRQATTSALGPRTASGRRTAGDDRVLLEPCADLDIRPLQPILVCS